MPSSTGWSAYVDVTGDPQVNGWTWEKVNNLSAYTGAMCVAEFNKVGKGNTMYCAKVEIRVTYTPGGPPADPTKYLAGKDCPVFPFVMNLDSDKLPCPPPY